MDAKQNTNTLNPVTQPKKNYNIRRYFQGIICNRDTRESGKKRNFWTNIILVILIISIVLLIICITLVLNANNNWWVYLIFGLLGIFGCVFGHYYNTKTYIENSKYDIDNDDIANFKKIKINIKNSIQTISQNKKEIDNLNRQINIIIGKNKAKSLASSIVSSKAKGKEKPLPYAVMETDIHVEETNTNGDTNTNDNVRNADGENDPQSDLPENSNKQSVPEDKQLTTLKKKLVDAKIELESKKTSLNEQIEKYNELKLLNDDYKKIKMANQHNKNIIYNISDLYYTKLLDDIHEIKYENNLLNNLNIDEKKIFNEYMAIIKDIYKIKSLNNTNFDISQKIINISKIDFEIEYLKNLKVNNLNKYIEEFFDDINGTLINKSDIDKYFTIIEKKNIINNSLETNYKDLLTKFNSKYTPIYNIIKDKYTNLAIEKINNIIGKDNEYSDKKVNEYSDEKVNELIEQYNKYSNKDLGDDFKKRYETIMKELVIKFGTYVYNNLEYSKTLNELLNTKDINQKILTINTHITGILQPLNSSKLHKYTTYPIISQNPNANSKDILLKIIAEPFVNELDKARNKKTTLEKAKAEADAKANKPLLSFIL